jgi:hypothetical protein
LNAFHPARTVRKQVSSVNNAESGGQYRMKQNAILAITSLLSILC